MKKKSFLSAVALSVFIAQSFAQSVNKGDPSVDWEGIYGHEPYRFYNGVAWAQKKGDEYWGVVDTHGKEITPFKYGSPNYEDSDASDGMISFKLDGKYGYMDMTGKEVIAPQFYYARQFHTGLAPVVNGNKWGVIRKDGSYLIEPKYGDIGLFEYRTAYVSNGDRDGDDYQIGIVDANGDLIVPMIYKAVKPVLGTGYALQDENNRWSVFNHKGVKIIDYGDKIDRFWYDWSSDSYGNIYEKGDGSGSYEGNKCGLLGQDGKILTPAIYDYVVGGADDAPSLAAWIFDAVLHVFKNEKNGFIDKLGKEVIPVIYEGAKGYDAWGFGNGNKHTVKLIPVKLNGKWGYVNLRGQTVIPFQYTEADDFDNGSIESERLTPVAKVTLADGTEGYIDAKGKFNVDADELRTLIQE